MKNFLEFWVRALPFTVGTGLTLVALCFLVEFCDKRLDLDGEEFLLFAGFFLAGFPTLVYGVNLLGRQPGPSE